MERGIGRMAWSVVLIVLGGYLGLLAILTVLQPHLLYFPHRSLTVTPSAIGLAYEAVSFQAADGVTLSGWFVPSERARGVLLFCHGNAGNMSHRLDSLQILHRLGLSTFIFDYRGYGQSEGTPTEQGTYLDAEAAWTYLVHTRQVAPTELIVFGRSLGGAIAAWLAHTHPPRALIIESTFSSLPELAAELYPYLPVKLLLRFDYNTVAYLRQVQRPVLIVHSREDEIIPVQHGQRLFAAASQPKTFLELYGTHNEGFLTSGSRYETGLESFLATYLRK